MARPKSDFLKAFGKVLEIWKALVDEVLSLGGTDESLGRILTDMDLRRQIANLIVGSNETAVASVKRILVRLFVDETILVGPTDGTETLATAFAGYLDGDFKDWKTKKPGKATGPLSVTVHEMNQNANFADMFGELGNLDALCFEQGQIKRFCANHRDKLRTNGYTTFFLFKVDGDRGPEYFVALIRVTGRGLEADVRRFDCSYVWYAAPQHRVVVPQLVTSAT